MINLYSDRREEFGIHQFGIVLWNDTTICVAVPTRWELWESTTVGGARRRCLFGFDHVEKQHTSAMELTLLFVLFSITWER